MECYLARTLLGHAVLSGHWPLEVKSLGSDLTYALPGQCRFRRDPLKYVTRLAARVHDNDHTQLHKSETTMSLPGEGAYEGDRQD